MPISGTERMGDGYFPISYGMYANTTLEEIAGHSVAPLEDVWRSKLALLRLKDMGDLEAIAKHTGRKLPPIMSLIRNMDS